MVEIENGKPGVLIHSKVKLLPLGPAGPFVLQGFLLQMGEHGPEVVGHMTFQADTLGLLEHGLKGFREAYASAMKNLLEEFESAKLMTQHSAETVRRISDTKLKGS